MYHHWERPERGEQQKKNYNLRPLSLLLLSRVAWWWWWKLFFPSHRDVLQVRFAFFWRNLYRLLRCVQVVSCRLDGGSTWSQLSANFKLKLWVRCKPPLDESFVDNFQEVSHFFVFTHAVSVHMCHDFVFFFVLQSVWYAEYTTVTHHELNRWIGTLRVNNFNFNFFSIYLAASPPASKRAPSKSFEKSMV